MDLSTLKMFEIIEVLQKKLQQTDKLSFEVLNPDVCEEHYAGNVVIFNGKKYRYRSYKSWIDLAQILRCKMLTPILKGQYTVSIVFKKLDAKVSFHATKAERKEEKYGEESEFFKICKNEEPSFLYSYMNALKNIDIFSKKRVLSLGVNRGDEFEVIEDMLGKEAFSHIELVGIDYSASAIAYASKRFAGKQFYTHDINKLDELNLEKFDLIISIGTLQSPGINFKPFFNSLIQNYLNENGAVILGFPNSRWVGGEMMYGAKMLNYSQSDLSLLIKDIHYCKKYLQQKRFNVRIGGKEYIFLSANKLHTASATRFRNRSDR